MLPSEVETQEHYTDNFFIIKSYVGLNTYHDTGAQFILKPIIYNEFS